MKNRLEFIDKDSNKFWEISVEGAKHTVTYGPIGAEGKSLTKTFSSAAEATADANRLLQDKRKKGYKDVATPTKASPKNGNEAVDYAIDELKAFFQKYPQGQIVIEQVDPKESKAALENVSEEKFFFDMHKLKFGRWLSKKKKPAKVKNSFDYFTRVYGTLTWAIGYDIKADTFLMGNVSGGGRGVLEIADDFNGDCSLEQIAENHPDHGFEGGKVFHGGWGSGGYIMDTRITSKEGEHPIYYFCGEDEDSNMLHTESINKKMTVQPFGFWLKEKVEEIIETLEPQLKDLQQKQQKQKEREQKEKSQPAKKDLLSFGALEDLAIGERGRLNQLFLDKVSGEIWGYSFYKNKFVIYNGTALVPNEREGKTYDAIAKKYKDDIQEMGEKRATLREVFIREDKENQLFVEIEACSKFLFVRRGWNNGYCHEERRVFQSPEECLTVAKELSAHYSAIFDKVDTMVGKKALIREFYHLSTKKYVPISIEGTSLFIEHKPKKYKSKEEALSAQEEALAKRRKDHVFKIIEW